MRIGDAEYVARVQQLLDEGKAVSRSEARRVIAQRECELSHTHAKLSPAETEQAIKEITGGAISTFERETIEDKVFGKGNVKITQAEVDKVTGGYITKSGRVYKNKPGRPKSGEK